jgi:arylsulfatase A-like enzyme
MLRPEEPHLATVLRSHNYRTALVGKGHTVEPEYLDASFDEHPEIEGGSGRLVGGPDPSDPMFRAFYRGKWEGNWEDHYETHIVDAGREFIRENAGRRFFLMLLTSA